jgi:hypothetical protein
LGDQIEDEMGGVCSTHRRVAYRVLVGKPDCERKRPFEDLGVYGRII